MTEPLVTAVMALYDAEPYVAEAVESVLGQTLAGVELIVVDDASSDGGPEIVRSYGSRVEVLSQTHAGCAVARNRGAGAARGHYLAFIDADDRWPPERLAEQVAVLEAEPQLAAVFGQMVEFVSPELDRTEAAPLRAPVARRPARFPTTMLLRRAAFWRVGPFAEDLRRALDIDWLARFDESGLAAEPTPGLALERRLNLWSNGMRERGNEIEYLHAVQAALARRRSAP